MRRKGFTLVELLVVIAIIALLMGILMPALSRVRQLAFRLTCGTNLSGIGKAMLIYANDYEDEFPRAGGPKTEWGAVSDWQAADRYNAFNVNRTNNSGGTATISSCFYLLVKYAEVTPKSFICKGDAGTTEFKLSELDVPSDFELIEAWDFGPTGEAYKHCSYAYHMPFGTYGLTVASEPGLAVAADRNPWLASPAGDVAPWDEFLPDLTAYGGSSEQAQAGNAIQHQNDGQNVLFLDSHVNFEKRSYCSLEDDNIYTISASDTTGDAYGTKPTANPFSPSNRGDSVLVHPVESVGGKGRRCFAAGTPTWVNGSLMPISKVAVGQLVIPVCKAGDSGLRPLRVEAVDAHPGVFWESRRVILANGESLHVVGSHLFLLSCGTWARVEQLQPGSILLTKDGPIAVAAIIRESEPYVGTVYNLKIADADHYFVGRTGVVVRDF